MIALIYSLVVLLLFSSMSSQAQYVLNVQGVDRRYRLFEFTESGRPWRPITADRFQHVAWPSAVKIENTTFVYASIYDGAHWSSVHRWKTNTTGQWVYDRMIFSANREERFGIGPTHILYDPKDEQPYTMFYLVRGPAGPGQKINVARSNDGVTWHRIHTAITPTLPEERSGLSVSYACKMGDTIFLFYQAYYTESFKALSIVAQGQSKNLNFTKKSIIIQPDHYIEKFDAHRGDLFASFHGKLPRLGLPLVLSNKTEQETVIPVEIIHQIVYFDRALLHSYMPGHAASYIRNKADLSYARIQEDGTWRAVITGYGAFKGVASEYTSNFEANDVAGPWKFRGDGFSFSPYFNDGVYSTENPERISTNADCRR